MKLNKPGTPGTETAISRGHWWSLAVVYFTLLVIAVGNVVYTQHVDHESNRKWCELIMSLDNAYKEAPPQTPTGIKIAQDVARLRVNLDCD